MGSATERELREAMGNPGPRSFDYNVELGRAMTAEEIEIVRAGGLVIPQGQADGTIEAVIIRPEDRATE